MGGRNQTAGPSTPPDNPQTDRPAPLGMTVVKVRRMAQPHPTLSSRAKPDCELPSNLAQSRDLLFVWSLTPGASSLKPVSPPSTPSFATGSCFRLRMRVG